MKEATTVTKLFKFEELTPEAQEKAIEANRTVNVEYSDWHECTIDQFKEAATEKGFEVGNVYFRGFWSQGDGAMFEYSRLDNTLRVEFIKSLNLSPMRESWLVDNTCISGSGSQKGLYHHEKSCSHSIYWEVDNGDLHWSTNFYKWIESFGPAFEEFIIELYEDLCHQLYKSLEKEYEYYTSEEHLREYFVEMDWEFTEEGKAV
jgi:hypothetical protein